MKTLKLDSSYRPIQIIDSFDAFCMIYMGRANMVESYDDKVIRSTHQSFPVPCVIALNRYVNVSKITLKCNRRNVFWRDRYTCQYCGKIEDEENLTLDHVTPKCKGGPKTWENIVTACQNCNQRKGSKLPHQVNMVPMRFPKAPSSYIFRTVGSENVHPKWIPYLDGFKPL